MPRKPTKQAKYQAVKRGKYNGENLTNLANKECRMSSHDPFKSRVDICGKVATAARFPPKKINPLAYHPY